MPRMAGIRSLSIQHRNLRVQQRVGAAPQLPHSAFIHTAPQAQGGMVSILICGVLSLHLRFKVNQFKISMPKSNVNSFAIFQKETCTAILWTNVVCTLMQTSVDHIFF